jgi:hypothetical protein
MILLSLFLLAQTPNVAAAHDSPPATTAADASSAVVDTPPVPAASQPATTAAAPKPDAVDPVAVKKARADKAKQVAGGVAVANAVSFPVLLTGGVIASMILLPISPLLGVAALAIPVVGVPLVVGVTAFLLVDADDIGTVLVGTGAGHYAGLVVGTIGGALVGLASGALLVFPSFNDSGFAGAVGVVVTISTAALGGVVGAGVGGTIGSAMGASVAITNFSE